MEKPETFKRRVLDVRCRSLVLGLVIVSRPLSLPLPLPLSRTHVHILTHSFPLPLFFCREPIPLFYLSCLVSAPIPGRFLLLHPSLVHSSIGRSPRYSWQLPSCHSAHRAAQCSNPRQRHRRRIDLSCALVSALHFLPFPASSPTGNSSKEKTLIASTSALHDYTQTSIQEPGFSARPRALLTAPSLR